MTKMMGILRDRGWANLVIWFWSHSVIEGRAVIGVLGISNWKKLGYGAGHTWC